MLQPILWLALKSKMRHMKASYLCAMAWKSQTGAGLLESGDENSVQEYIKKICPHWDLLENIFHQRKNINPCIIFESRSEEDFLSESPQGHQRKENLTNSFNNNDFELLEDLAETSCSSARRCPLHHTAYVQVLNRKKVSENQINSLLLIQEKKLKFEKEKFELEKEKENN